MENLGNRHINHNSGANMPQRNIERPRGWAQLSSEMTSELSEESPSEPPDWSHISSELNSDLLGDQSDEPIAEFLKLPQAEFDILDLDARLQVYDAFCRGQLSDVSIPMHVMNSWTDEFREQYWSSEYAAAYLDDCREERIAKARTEHPEIYSRDNNEAIDRQTDFFLNKISESAYRSIREAYRGNREQGIILAGQELARVLGLEEAPETLFAETNDVNIYGSQKDNVVTIYSCPHRKDDFYEDMNTIAHESFHVYQHGRADLGLTEHDALYRININAYIPSRTDYKRYREQLIEAEAFNFGDNFSARFQQSEAQLLGKEFLSQIERLKKFGARVLKIFNQKENK